jgi:hypothetical protein
MDKQIKARTTEENLYLKNKDAVPVVSFFTISSARYMVTLRRSSFLNIKLDSMIWITKSSVCIPEA